MDRELDSSLIRFRPLSEEDLAVLHDWLHTPHVQMWWDTPATLEEMRAEYLPRIQDEHPATPFVILCDDAAIGYIQTYPVRAGEWGDLAPPGAIGLDLFIGDPAYVHRGLGPRILTRFLNEIAFARSDAARCFVDPPAHNRVAIRAFEKAGFRYVGTVHEVGTAAPVYLMCIDRTG